MVGAEGTVKLVGGRVEFLIGVLPLFAGDGDGIVTLAGVGIGL